MDITAFIGLGGTGNDSIFGGAAEDFVFADDTVTAPNQTALLNLIASGVDMSDAVARASVYALVLQESNKRGGMDTIATYGGADFIDSGDETVAPTSSAGIISSYYKPDGTPFDVSRYDVDTGLVTLTAQEILDQDFKLQNIHGDVIMGGTGSDIIYAGSGNDQISGGSGNNEVYAGEGDDLIDARESTGSFYGEEGEDTILWNYIAGSNIIVDGGDDADILSAVLNDNANEVTLAKADGSNAAVLSVRDNKAITDVAFDQITLTNVENLTLELKAGDDDLQISDLIDTDLVLVDVDAGSELETMWQADTAEGQTQAVTRADNHLQYIPVIPSLATNISISYLGESIEIANNSEDSISNALMLLAGVSESELNSSDLALSTLTHLGKQRLLANLDDFGFVADNQANYALLTVQYTDAQGSHSVYADTGVTTSDSMDARQGDYFYRVSLESGIYLFDPVTSEPILEDIYVPATQQSGNDIQEITLGKGLDKVTLFYGYNTSAINNGMVNNTDTPDFNNVVTLYSWMTAEQIASAINDTLDNVTVSVASTDDGETGSPWIIKIDSAGPKQFAYYYQQQSFSGEQYKEIDSTNLDAFLRITDADTGIWDYAFNSDGSPTLIFETAMINNQLVWADWMKTAAIQMGTEQVNLLPVYQQIIEAQDSATLTGNAVDWSAATNALRDIIGDFESSPEVKLSVSTLDALPVWNITEIQQALPSNTYTFTNSDLLVDESVHIFYGGLYKTINFDDVILTSDQKSQHIVVDRNDNSALTTAVAKQVKALTGFDAQVSYDNASGQWIITVAGSLDASLQLTTKY